MRFAGISQNIVEDQVVEMRKEINSSSKAPAVNGHSMPTKAGRPKKKSSPDEPAAVQDSTATTTAAATVATKTKSRGRPKKEVVASTNGHVPGKRKQSKKVADLDEDGQPVKRRKTSSFLPKAILADFNPLPTLGGPGLASIGPDKSRCGNALNRFTFEEHPWLDQVEDGRRFALMFGAGDMGQMGLGPEKLDDIRRPVIHQGIEELRKRGEMGSPMHAAGGGMHSLLVDDAGRVWSWGINDNAALGRTTEGVPGVEQEELESRPMPVKLDPDTDCAPFKAVRVSAGDSVSVAVSDEGELVAWGSFRSNDGLLGFDGKLSGSVKQLSPRRVANLSEHPVSQVVCGYDHVLALTTEGHVYGWGNGQQQQLGRKIIERRKRNGLTPERLLLKRIVLVGTGGSHSFAVDDRGRVFGWGLNTRGQLGIGPEEKCWRDEIVEVPTRVRAMEPDRHGGARVVAVEGGDFHSLFLLSNGEVWGVGNYENGEVGIAKSRDEVATVERERKAGVAAREAFMTAETAKRRKRFERRLSRFEERVKIRKSKGEEDEEESRPRWDEAVEQMEVAQKAAGKGFVPGECLREPARLDFARPVVDISCGTRHNLAVDADGNAYSWGLGQSNELGQGKDSDGEDIEMLESPKRLSSKALNEDDVAGKGLGKVRVIGCVAGGTHSMLIGVAGKSGGKL